MNQILNKTLKVFMSALIVISQLFLQYQNPLRVNAAYSVSVSSGNTTYINTAVTVDPTIVVDLNGGSTSTAKVNILNGVSGDLLSFTDTLPNGTQTWNSSNYTLTFAGTFTSDQLQTIFRSVKFSTTSSDKTTRNVNFTLGNVVSLKIGNVDHYYEIVSGSRSWTSARDDAATKELFGLKGYLATITSDAENTFIKSKVSVDSWIGASDETVEGTWKWVTGPESGTLMSSGYTNWASGEPNNSNNEDYGQFYANAGNWNDLSNVNNQSAYVVEYGGMSGDPTVQLSATRTVALNYTVTYNSNNATSGSTPLDSNTYLSSATVSILANTGNLSRTGYEFGGWNTNVDGSGISYQAGDVFNISGFVNLYAQWFKSSSSSGDLTYLQNSNAINVDPNYILEGPYMNLALISIREYMNGDVLSYDDSVSGITSYYRKGRLMLSSITPKPASDFQAAIRAIKFYSNATFGTRTIDIAVNTNGHRYELFNSNLTWANAKSVAVNDKKGYLATITSEYEDVIISLLDKNNSNVSSAWIGAQSTWSVVGVTPSHIWKWETGPEIGTQFWQGAYPTGSKVNGMYSRWAVGEPNSGSRNGAYWYAQNGWDNNGADDATLDYYIVEYGSGSAAFTSATRIIDVQGLTVAYASNGATSGTIPNDTNDYASGNSVTVIGNTGNLAKTGYTFGGWSFNSATYQAGNTFNITGNATLTAIWNAASQTINYNANSGTGTLSASTANTNANVTLKTNVFSKSGYAFSGWATSSGGSVVYADGASLTMPAGGLTLYAVWSPTNQTIQYNANGGNGTSMDPSTALTGSSTILTTNIYTKANYNFAGWATSANGTVFYADQASLTMPAGGLTLYAKWIPVDYSITYVLDGGINPSSNPSSYTVETSSFNLASPTKTGYTFSHWTNDLNQTITSISVGSSGDRILTAHYTINQYTVAFESNGGSAVNSQSIEYQSTVERPSTPTRTAYVFDGWKQDEALTQAFDFSSQISQAKTLYAKWVPVGYTITYETNGGTTTNPTTYNIETSTITLSAPSRTGYTFSHWMLNGQKVTEIPTGTSGDLTLTAVYATTLKTSLGETSYSQAQISVDPDLAVASDQSIPGLKISIRNGISGDRLSFGETLPNGTSASYNASTYILTLTGTLTSSQAQALLRSVIFETTNTDNTTRILDITLGSAVGVTLNGKTHYYDYIPGSFTWSEALTDAASKSLFGLQGYLATITSSDENAYIFSKLRADAWIGGTDNALAINQAVGSTRYADQIVSENHWTWISGPEKGTEFSLAEIVNSGQYANWADGEPNNYNGSEDYAELYSSNEGKWNDLPNDSQLGYVVEYGGYTSDLNQLMATKSIIMQDRYRVTYQDYDGEQLSSQIVFSGDDASAPNAPTRTGYTFAGWSAEGTHITSTTTITATYTPRTDTVYQVKFYLQNTPGNGYEIDTVRSLSFSGTTASTVGVTAPTIAGFHENTSHAQRLARAQILADGSLVLQLFYDRNLMDVTFKNGETTHAVSQVLYDASVASPQTPVRNGYTFVRWTSDALFQQAYDFDTSVVSDLTLHAQWSINTYDIDYELEDGQVTETLIDSYTTLDQFDLPTPTKEGHIFTGWTLEDDETLLTQHMSGHTGNLIYTAHYRLGQFALNYHNSDIPSVLVSYQATQPTPPTPIWEGYDFKGWSLDAQGIQTYEPTRMPARVVDVYAQWKPHAYAISYDLQGGLGFSPTSYTLLDSVNLGSATREGYTFMGWLDENNQVVSAWEKGAMGDRHFVAQWQFAPRSPSIESAIVEAVTESSALIRVRMKDRGNPAIADLAFRLTGDGNTRSGSFKDAIQFNDLIPYTDYLLTLLTPDGTSVLSSLSFTTQPLDSDQDGVPDARDQFPQDASKSFDASAILKDVVPSLSFVGSLETPESTQYTLDLKAADLWGLKASDTILVTMGSVQFTIPVALVDQFMAREDATTTTLTLKVEPQVNNTTIPKDLLDDLNQDLLAAYDYRLLQVRSDGQTTPIHQLNGTIQVGIGLEGLVGSYDPNTLEVYYYNTETGVVESMKALFDPATQSLVFDTSHFSYYVIGVKKKDDPAKTSLQLIGLAMALIIAAISFFKRRKKANLE